MIYRFKTTPFPHQYRAVKRALRRGHIGLLWDPGIGKTKVIIDWACALWVKGDLQRVLIVCPMSVMGVWEDEWALHAPASYWLTMMDETRTAIPTVGGALHVVVINYDKIWRDNVKESLRKFDPQMVVADESHRIKKASTNRSWAMRAWRTVPYRGILTGTPAPKSLLDLYPQWVFLNPNRFGTVIGDFKDRYIVFGGYMRKQIKGYRRANLPELKSKIKADASIIRASTVLDLPPETHQPIPIKLEPETQLQYDKLEYELFLELKSGRIVDVKNAAVKVLRLQQIVGGFVGTEEGEIEQVSEAKLRTINDLLQDRVATGQRIVVFCRFLPEIEAIHQICTKLKVRTYVLRGGVRRSDRDKMRRAFQTKRGPSVFLSQIQTGGLGITLHASHEAIFYSVTYALDDYIQACKRLHREGQKHPVIYRHLIVKNSIDEGIYEALQSKEDTMNLIMGHPEKLLKKAAQRYKQGVRLDEVDRLHQRSYNRMNRKGR